MLESSDIGNFQYCLLFHKVMLGVDELDVTPTFNSFKELNSGKYLMGSYFGGLKPKSYIHILLNKQLEAATRKVVDEVAYTRMPSVLH